MPELRTAADLVRTLGDGTYRLQDVYRRAEQHGLADRPGARDDAGDGQARYKPDVRPALYAEECRRRGRAQRTGRATWLIDGTPQCPRRALFVWLPRDPGRLELVLGEATRVLAETGEPIDLVFADPPWGLARGEDSAAYQGVYRRDRSKVMPGYQEVPDSRYAAFTADWVAAAVAALRPGGYLAAVAGPQRAARIQCAAEDAGLTYVNSITVGRRFGVHCTRRPAHQHHVVSLLTKGPLDSRRRVFHQLPEFPRGRNGGKYGVDVWDDVPAVNRVGLLRWDNMLHPMLPGRVIRLTIDEGDLVCDPFLGGGSTVEACLKTGRRFYGGDKSERAAVHHGQAAVRSGPSAGGRRPGADTVRPGRCAVSATRPAAVPPPGLAGEGRPGLACTASSGARATMSGNRFDAASRRFGFLDGGRGVADAPVGVFLPDRARRHVLRTSVKTRTVNGQPATDRAGAAEYLGMPLNTVKVLAARGKRRSSGWPEPLGLDIDGIEVFALSDLDTYRTARQKPARPAAEHRLLRGDADELLDNSAFAAILGVDPADVFHGYVKLSTAAWGRGEDGYLPLPDDESPARNGTTYWWQRRRIKTWLATPRAGGRRSGPAPSVADLRAVLAEAAARGEQLSVQARAEALTTRLGRTVSIQTVYRLQRKLRDQ